MTEPERYVTYRNTDTNAQTVGWARLPEYWVGSPENAYVTHDTRLGLFFFHNTPNLFEGTSIVHDLEKLHGAIYRI